MSFLQQANAHGSTTAPETGDHRPYQKLDRIPRLNSPKGGNLAGDPQAKQASPANVAHSTSTLVITAFPPAIGRQIPQIEQELSQWDRNHAAEQYAHQDGQDVGPSVVKLEFRADQYCQHDDGDEHHRHQQTFCQWSPDAFLAQVFRRELDTIQKERPDRPRQQNRRQRPDELEPRYSSLARPTFRRMRTTYRGTGQALRGRWVLKGGPALMDSTSPHRGEKERHPVLDTGPAITRQCAWRPVRWR